MKIEYDGNATTRFNACVAFEIYHIHGESAIEQLAKDLNLTVEYVMSEIARFGSSLTKPYEIKAYACGLPVVIKTVDMASKSGVYKDIKIKVERKAINVEPRSFKTDEEGFIRIKQGDNVFRVKPEEFFGGKQPDILATHGPDIEDLMHQEIRKLVEKEMAARDEEIKKLVVPYLTDEEIRAEYVRRGLQGE